MAVRWPGQSAEQAAEVERRLREAGYAEFHHAFNNRLRGRTTGELELLASLAALGDWYARETYASAIPSYAPAFDERVLTRLETALPEANAATRLAFGSLAWCIGYEGRARGFWSLSDHPSAAALVRLTMREVPIKTWEAPPQSAEQLLYELGQRLIHEDQAAYALECMVQAARLGHEGACDALFEFRPSLADNLALLERLVDCDKPTLVARRELVRRRMREPGYDATALAATLDDDVMMCDDELVRLGQLTQDEIDERQVALVQKLNDIAASAPN